MADQGVTSDQAPLTDNLGIGLTARAALSLQRGQILVRLFLLALVLCLLVLGWTVDKETEAAAIFSYYCRHILLPLLLVIVIQLICNIYSIIAWTRTSLRYVFVDVFYVTVFSRSISLIFCVYMIVMIFKPHYFFDSTKMQVFNFDLTYTVVGAIVFIYVILDDLVVISFVTGLYFKMDKFVKVLTKYSWVRRVCCICIDLLLVGYYLYCLTTRGSGHVTASLLGLCLGSALANAYVLYKQICQPKTFKMKNLEELEPPKDLKIQTAFKIVKMKADVKDYANTAAGSA